MRRFYRSLLAVAAPLLLVGGTLFQSCSPVAGLVNQFRGFNPCGTILDCNPVQYQFVQSGLGEPGANLDADPFCVFPPFCAAAVDPLYGGP